MDDHDDEALIEFWAHLCDRLEESRTQGVSHEDFVHLLDALGPDDGPIVDSTPHRAREWTVRRRAAVAGVKTVEILKGAA
jgi:hypothetical protein